MAEHSRTTSAALGGLRDDTAGHIARVEAAAARATAEGERANRGLVDATATLERVWARACDAAREAEAAGRAAAAAGEAARRASEDAHASRAAAEAVRLATATSRHHAVIAAMAAAAPPPPGAWNALRALSLHAQTGAHMGFGAERIGVARDSWWGTGGAHPGDAHRHHASVRQQFAAT